MPTIHIRRGDTVLCTMPASTEDWPLQHTWVPWKRATGASWRQQGTPCAACVRLFDAERRTAVTQIHRMTGERRMAVRRVAGGTP